MSKFEENAFFYKIFQGFPQIPEEYKKRLIGLMDIASPDNIFRPTPATHINIYNGKKYYSAETDKWLLENHPQVSDIVDWLNENILPNKVTLWEITRTQTRDRTMMPLHTDKKRQFALMYVLESGGPDSCTRFFKEKNKDVVRENNIWQIRNLDELIEVGGVSLPVESWAIINARILHAVTGIDEGRLSIQGFLDKTEDFIEEDDYDYVTLPKN